MLTKNSPLGLKVQPQLPAGLHLSAHKDILKCFWVFSPHSYDATLNSTSTRHPHFKCLCTPLFLSSVPQSSTYCHNTDLLGQVFMAQMPVIVVNVSPNNSFIVIFFLFVSPSHLYLSVCIFLLHHWGDKRQIKALLPRSACLSRHKAPLCGSLTVCPGPDYSWQRHW